MIKLATVFSGIGAVEQALKQLLGDQYEIVFACDNGERYFLHRGGYSKEN